MADKKVIVITGASSGIGKSLALSLNTADYQIVLGARSVEKLHLIERSIRQAGGQCLAIPLDVSCPESIYSFFQIIKIDCGKLDVLVNNAGIGFAESIASVKIDQAKKLFDVNFFGSILCIQSALPLMSSGSKIINISSITSFRGGPKSGIYSASKAALDRISDSLRMELKGLNISVTTIHPGYTSGTSFHDAIPEFKGKAEENSVNHVVASITTAIDHSTARKFINLRGFLMALASHLIPHWLDRLQLLRNK